jgi:hypothetical protein
MKRRIRLRMRLRRRLRRWSLLLLRRFLIKAIILTTAMRTERSMRTIVKESNLILVIFATFTSTSLILYLC